MNSASASTGFTSSKHYFAYGALCLLWGSTWIAVRVLVRDVPPFRAASIRFVLAAAILGLAGAAMKLQFPRSAREWRSQAILGITMMTVPYAAVFWAEQHITASLTALLFASFPLVVAIWSPILTGQTVPRRALFSIVVGFGGTAALFFQGVPYSRVGRLSAVAVLIGVVSAAWATVSAKREVSLTNPLVSTGIQMAVAAVLTTTASLTFERGQESHWTAASLSMLLLLAVFGSAVAFSLYYWLLRDIAAYQLGTIDLVVPLVATLEGTLLLREYIPPLMVAAMLVVLGAVLVVIRSEGPEEAISLSGRIET
ncbi:MAG TPA: EamA family transporter [Terriglobales bacterium]|nr:EamA family transporter [Terriglobales bacterium]